MCGICGKLSFAGGPPVGPELVKKMCSTLRHRGPDDQGIYTDEWVGLGQLRLSINDLRAMATAPLSNEDDTVWLIFNGEIYNFIELRETLQKCGHVFKTKTDTEVVIHAYEEYGYDCLNYFNGMFAFALWDTTRKELFCARDRFGKKPFCYALDGDSFRFGSEIKAIIADPNFKVEANHGCINTYLSYGYIPSPLSAFDGVSKLQPGHFLVCGINGSFRVERYWEPDFSRDKTSASIPDIKEELSIRLQEAVKLRMISDVPLGAFLSGGLDSTTIVALMAQQSSRPIKTFSIGFKDDVYNELPYAKLLAERYGTDHHEFIVEPDAAEVLPDLARHYNEPFADASALPTYYLSQMTREHVTVALSGDGGDESFAGYDRYENILFWNDLSKKLQWAQPLFQSMECGMDKLRYSNFLARFSRGCHMLGGGLADQYRLQMTAGLKPQEKHEILADAMECAISRFSSVDPIAKFDKGGGLNAVEYCMLHDQNFYLPDDLMVKTDIASMAHSLEVRSPLLDYRIAEYVATIPVDLKRRNGIGKWIFKETFGDLLPNQILNKPKSGFSIPRSKWLREDLNSMLHDLLLDDTARSRGIFNTSKVARMIKEHERCARDWGNRLWTMLILEIWFRECIDYR